MDVEGGHSSAIFVLILAAVILGLLLRSERKEPNLKHIPPIGRTNYLLSYLDAFIFSSNGIAELRRGCDKYRPNVFRISTLNRWLVIITGTKSIEELRKATEEEVSFVSIAHEPDVPLYFLGHWNAVASQQLNVLTRHITQNTTFLLPDMKEEIMHVLRNAIPVAQGSAEPGWQEINAVSLVVQLTTKTMNRVFLGLPHSRDEEFAHLSAALACDVYGFKLPLLSNLLPKTLVSIFRIFSASHQNRRRLQWLTSSFVRERRNASDTPEHKNEHRNYDLLSWILDHESTQQSPEEIASNLVNLNVTANQTMSMTFAHVLYHLAANPKYAAPIRKEIEGVVMREGWSKNSVERMRKVDSFVKESMRMSGVSSVSVMRKFMKPFTFSDGTQLPQGTLAAVAAEPRHLDLESCSYPFADVFDGFRFSKLHEHHHGEDPATGGGMHAQSQLITTSPDYLAWGYGRHACPGRFVAAVVLKMMLAHVVLNYDVRFEDGVRPRDVCVGMSRLVDPRAKMLVRKR